MAKFFSIFYNINSKKRYTQKENDDFLKNRNLNSSFEFRYQYLLRIARSPLFKKYFKRIVNAESMGKMK